MNIPVLDPFAATHRRKRLRTIASVALVFCFGFFSARAWDLRMEILATKGASLPKVLNLYSNAPEAPADFQQFWDVWQQVKEKYVTQPVDDKKLFYGAIQGIVRGLDDPYSIFFPPQKADLFKSDLEGSFDGIGAQIGMQNDQIMVIAPLDDSPAKKAGLMAGDAIYKINGKQTQDMDVDEAVSLIRGKRGTTVTLTIGRKGLNALKDISIVRDVISQPSVTIDEDHTITKDSKIAYIRISSFNKDTFTRFDGILKKLFANGKPNGIILDLRSNPGGFLDVSVKVASEWIDKGVVVKEQFQGNERNEYQVTGSHRLLGIPTVVLVDGGSASASEIVSGALQDYGVATLVGQKTYGKGSVQDYEDLPGGGALKLTVAKWFTPKGRGIDKAGIEPDVKVDPQFEEVTDQKGEKTVVDHGVEKALEVLYTALKH